MDREIAVMLLKKYNQEEFHLRHAVTVEAVMRYFAEKRGEDVELWGLAGLLHDVDFEKYPEEHCVKAPELLAEIDAPEELVHAVCSHGYGIVSDVKPEKEMELKSLKKKFKDKRFAAGCSRDIIRQGAEQLGWELDELLGRTLEAMQEKEDEIEKAFGEAC